MAKDKQESGELLPENAPVFAAESLGATDVEDALVDSQTTTLHYEIESKIGEVTSPKWKLFVPISYGTTGGQLTTVEPDELESSGQTTKGSPTQVAATAEFSANVKHSNLQDFVPGMLRAKYQERGSTARKETITNPETVTAVVSDGYTTTNTGGDDWSVPTGAELLIYASGFQNAANNGRKIVTATTATKVSVENLTAATDKGGRLEVIGVRTPATADYKKAASGALAKLDCEADISKLKVVVGEWVQVVNDDSNPSMPIFYGRVASVATSGGKSSINFSNVVGIGGFDGENVDNKRFAIYIANRYINNPARKDIRDCTYQFKRTVKDSEVQTITGSLANTMSMSVPSVAKMESTMGFISRRALTNDTNTISGSNEIAATDDTMYNTSSDVKLVSLYKDSDKADLFADFGDLSVDFNNGLTARYKVGSKFSLGASRAAFAATMSGTAYFRDLTPIESAEENHTVGGVILASNESGGVCVDMPGMTVVGDVAISRGEPVTINVTNSGFKGAEGYTTRFLFYPYLEAHGE